MNLCHWNALGGGHSSPRERKGMSNLLGSCVRLSLCVTAPLAFAHAAYAGSFTPLSHQAPGGVGTMLLLSDGTVLAQQASGAGGNGWYKLTPDSHGSYVNGTWTTVASMHDTRLYFSSDVLPSGKVLIAGAEDGTGGSTAEIYDPVANTWTYTPT